MQTKIIYEDDAIWVVHKPAGLATQTARVGEKDVVSELKNACRGGYVGVIHRLDQPVEGLLVFAKTKQAAGKLSAALQAEGREGSLLNKEYAALVYGAFTQAQGRLDHYLLKTPQNTARVYADRASAPKEAKRAGLTYEVIAASEKHNLSLVQVRLETGRFHQIRAQMAAAGHPLLGDQKYGTAESRALSGELGIRTAALLARRITLQHPVTGKEMSYEIPLRKEWTSTYC